MLAAVVWNFGSYAPEAQITNQAGLLVQGDGASERIVDTGKQWKGIRDAAYEPVLRGPEMARFYFVVGPGDRVDGGRYPWGWERPEFDDSRWPAAVVGSPGAPRDSQDGPNRWMLVPR